MFHVSLILYVRVKFNISETPSSSFVSIFMFLVDRVAAADTCFVSVLDSLPGERIDIFRRARSSSTISMRPHIFGSLRNLLNL